MIRRRFAWTCLLLLAVLGASSGCNALQTDAEVSREQWEPEVDTAAKTSN